MNTRLKAEGFTLIEMLISLAIFSIIVATLYGTLFMAHRAVSGNDTSMLRLHELRSLMDIMRREVEAALPDKKDALRFRIRDRDYYGNKASELEFTTFGTNAIGAAKVLYYIKYTDGEMVLFKQTAPAFSEFDRSREAAMLEGIESFSVEALVGNTWQPVWDQGRLPDMVRITISVTYRDRLLTLTETLTPKIGKKA